MTDLIEAIRAHFGRIDRVREQNFQTCLDIIADTSTTSRKLMFIQDGATAVAFVRDGDAVTRIGPIPLTVAQIKAAIPPTPKTETDP